MRTRPSKTLAAIGVTALAGWSGASLACPSEPYISTVCIMANNFAPVGFLQAAGQQLPIRGNETLFALIGVTYGGDGSTSFKLPDLRGRFLLGAGQQPNGVAYVPGANGGNEAVTLTSANLPTLQSSQINGYASIPMAAATVDLAGATGLAATLSGMTFTANADGLSLKGTDTAGAINTANGNALGTANTPNVKLYVNATPNVTMAPGSIAGTITGTIPATTAKVNFQGKAAVQIPAQSATVSGTVVFPNASQQPISIMPPYLAMNYYIAVQGIYPQRP